MCGPPHISFSCCVKIICSFLKKKAQEGRASEEMAKERSEPPKADTYEEKKTLQFVIWETTFHLSGKERSVWSDLDPGV